MRLSFASGILCAGFFAVSCVQRDYNKAETKAVTDAKTIVKNPDGTFTVTCDWGAVENNVTADQVNKNDVCKVTHVDPKAFNAFLLWRDGKGTPMLDYPNDYFLDSVEVDSDGVFFVAEGMYWKNELRWDGRHVGRYDFLQFIGSATEGAKVEGDLLTYLTKEGRSLAIRFSAPAPSPQMTLEAAAQHCKGMGLRLPHSQELLDFCVAGTAVVEVHSGKRSYLDGRCKRERFWSASSSFYKKHRAWIFDGFSGDIEELDRHSSISGVRCVGPAR